MKYSKVVTGKFIERPNRFIARVEIDGKEETVHVKNTGRCCELLVPNANVLLEVVNSPNRKTGYDLIAVYKGNTLINMDSYAPNKVALEFIKNGGLFSRSAIIKPEYKYGNSRIDIYVQDGDTRALIEVKGVTLENEGVSMFPDAPTERGVKHVNELIKAVAQGYDCYLLFVIQMKGVCEFKPNYKTHRAFGEALQRAQKAGVKILAYDCIVTPDTLRIDVPVSVNLEKNNGEA